VPSTHPPTAAANLLHHGVGDTFGSVRREQHRR
jgi:hypothetical protein